jgi:predicted phosphodiesterase
MPKIGILSDTHGYIDSSLFTFFADCEEIWHAGDWGSVDTVKQLENFKDYVPTWNLLGFDLLKSPG